MPTFVLRSTCHCAVTSVNTRAATSGGFKPGGFNRNVRQPVKGQSPFMPCLHHLRGRQQGAHLTLRGTTRDQVGQTAFEKHQACFRRRGEQSARRLIFHGAPSECDHHLMVVTQQFDRLPFPGAKLSFAMPAEDLCHRKLAGGFNDRIQVEKTPPQGARQQGAHGRFTSSHEAGEH